MPRQPMTIAALLLAATMPLHGARAAAAPEAKSCVAGYYRGSEMEIAAELMLDPSGHFSYALTYGGADESAHGTWREQGGNVLLTSDPVKESSFTLVDQGEAQDGKFHVDLDVPEGIDRQYFDAQVTFSNGSERLYQLAEDGLSVALDKGLEPKSIRMVLPMYDVAGQWREVEHGTASRLHFTFEPNDFGVVAFSDEPLARKGDTLVLGRTDRTLALKRQGGDCGAVPSK